MQAVELLCLAGLEIAPCLELPFSDHKRVKKGTTVLTKSRFSSSYFTMEVRAATIGLAKAGAERA